MANGNIIANNSLGALERAMYYSSILDVHLVTDPNDVYITTQNCIEPNTAPAVIQ